ncbi:MAG: macro domain-containing protein [Candidatus Hodarchaeales archaeon]
MKKYSIIISKKYKQSLDFLVGDILDEIKKENIRVEVFVNPTDGNFSTTGKIFESNYGGQPLKTVVEELRTEQSSTMTKFHLNKAFLTSGGNFNEKVIHVPLLPLDTLTSHIKAVDVFTATINILEAAKSSNLTSIAIPEIGSDGNVGLTLGEAARSMVDGLISFFREDFTPLRVLIIVSKPEMYPPFKKELENRQIALKKPDEVANDLKKSFDKLTKEIKKDKIPMQRLVDDLNILTRISDIAQFLNEYPIPELEFDWYRKVVKQSRRGKSNV